VSIESEISALNAAYSRLDPRIAEELQVFSERIKSLISRIESRIDELRSSLSSLYVDLFYSTLETNFESYHQILIDYTSAALNASREYNYPPFKTALLRAVSSPGILNIELSSARNTNFQIYVIIKMDEYCGNLQEYMDAVETVRIQEGWGLTRDVPYEDRFGNKGSNLAAKIWREKIYKVDREGGKVYSRKMVRTTGEGRKYRSEIIDETFKFKGKYAATITLRFSEFTHKAPFWSLIEYGTAFWRGGGNAGDAYPQEPPQRFVNRTIGAIKNIFGEDWRSRYYQESEPVNELIKKYKSEIIRLEELLVSVLAQLRKGQDAKSQQTAVQYVETVCLWRT
jgi:hypothetical protein